MRLGTKHFTTILLVSLSRVVLCANEFVDPAKTPDCGIAYQAGSHNASEGEKYPRITARRVDLPSKSEIPALESLGYSDLQVLESGGMATVISAVRDGKRVALKVLHDEFKNGATFEYEAEIMNALNAADPTFSKGTRLDVNAPDGVYRVIEMDFVPLRPGSNVPAKSLHDMLNDTQFWAENPNARESIRRQVAGQLLRANKLGITHQDIKPGNILVSFDSEGNPVAKVIDWGLAGRIINGRFQSGFRKPGKFAGTPGYFPHHRYYGHPSELSDDVYAARIVDWETRNAVYYHNDAVDQVIRHINPAPLPFEPSGADPAAPKESDRTGPYMEPAYALDASGTLSERLTAMAEWSRLPKTVVERERLILSARHMPEEAFLKLYGQKLSGIWEGDSRVRTPRPKLTTEILESTVLIDNFDTRVGLQLSKEEVEKVARTAAAFYLETEKFKDNPDSLPGYGPHPLYHYTEFGLKIDSLAKAGITKPWADWVKEARGGHIPASWMSFWK